MFQVSVYFFVKIATPPPPAERGGAHYGYASNNETIQKTEIFIQISIPKNNNMSQLRSCEGIIFAAWPDT